jgi:putative FmdB family regulatory protein
MPIYEYRCAACGHEVEALQKLSDPPLSICPACQKAELRKLVSAAGFQLKGSGWYVTDFRNSGAKPAAKDKPAAGDATATANGQPSTPGAAETKSDAPAKPAPAAPEAKAPATSTPGAKSEG